MLLRYTMPWQASAPFPKVVIRRSSLLSVQLHMLRAASEPEIDAASQTSTTWR
jgi:hypothetical protein